MTIVHKTTSIVRYKIDDIEVGIKPLTFLEKASIQKLTQEASVGDMAAAMNLVTETIAICLKDIKGLTNEDGSEYKLEIKDGRLTQECIDDLLNLPHTMKLTQLCSAFLNGIPTQVIGPDQKPVEGITLVSNTSGKTRKK